MSLKKAVTLWNEAVILSQRGKYEESIDTFQNIVSQSAKIQYNIGCVNLFLTRYVNAIKSFDAALGHDRFLAVGYFQRAVAKFHLHQYAEADQDLNLARQNLRGELFIDYHQLGLPFTLYLYQIVQNLAVIQLKQGNESAAHRLFQESVNLQSQKSSQPIPQYSSRNGLKLFELPHNSALFCPPKSMVDNLEKKDFLGKAKVVSSVIEHDTFVGFEGNRKSHSVPGSPVIPHQLAISRSRTPPLPSRPPPRLPAHAHSKVDCCVSQTERTAPKCRPPPPRRTAPRLCVNSTTTTEQSNLNR
ncbi:neutrophil cytosol factor 2-like [Gigantopelta aegis]|uniref:neutrophil cytosol factor 2-like n=1 Tax=Gigantopelta aegis TaxID=1735272 RepID=UPI001B887D08|nr:neutrophil cytosol factor 2-like [Gigantopelta aegis]